ncbi:MAG: alanine/glycine:cation symporter family protein [Flavobacterium sp.]
MIESFLNTCVSSLEWVMLILVIGGGLVLVFQSRLLPYSYFGHAISIIAGKHDQKNETGSVSHFEALSAVIAATVGMGNISGVAIAINQGGPGVVFWMWVTALIGCVIKFYSCSLSILYRKVEKDGSIASGPMYYMKNGITGYGKYLALIFATVGMVGVLPMFTSNQLTQALIDVTQVNEYFNLNILNTKIIIGIVLVIITSYVVFGGLQKIVKITSALVPFMVLIYVLVAVYILMINYEIVPNILKTIFQEAFNLKTSVIGGLSGLIIIGMRRAVFSNESGVGTAPIYHGQSKTDNPVKEGFVAMLGPFIDTVIVCTVTAIIILISKTSLGTEKSGILITLDAFNVLLGSFGKPILLLVVIVFAVSTLFTYSFYGTQCLQFLTNKPKNIYNYIYIISIFVAAILSLDIVLGIIDLSFAIMSITNMVALIILSKKITPLLKKYKKNES